MKRNLNHRTAFLAFTAALFFSLPVSAKDLPDWNSSGDSVSVKITYSTIAVHLKKEESPEIKVLDAVLSGNADETVSVAITVKILNPQFNGTICKITTNLSIVTLNTSGSSVKMNSSNVDSCKTNRGAGMDSLVKAAAGIALKKMIPNMENDIKKSIDEALLPAVKILKSKTSKNVDVKYSIHDAGISLFLFTDKLIENGLKKITYSLDDKSGCMNPSGISIYQLPSSETGENRIRVFIRNTDKNAELEADMSVSTPANRLHSEKIKTNSEYYWSDDPKSFSGKDFIVHFRLFPSAESGGAECGLLSFQVPDRASVLLEIAR